MSEETKPPIEALNEATKAVSEQTATLRLAANNLRAVLNHIMCKPGAEDFLGFLLSKVAQDVLKETKT